MKLTPLHIACCCFLVVACLVACKSPAVTTSEARKDSTRIEYRDREVPVTIPGEKIVVTQSIECDSNTNKPKPKSFEVDGARSKAKGSIDSNGKLTTECVCDSLTTVLHAKDSIISVYKSQSKEETKVNEVYLVHWYDKWARVIALLAIIFFIYKLKSTFIP